MPRHEITQLQHSASAAQDWLLAVLGGGSPLLAFVVSHLETLELWLRITSLLVGIAVGLFTLRNIIRRK